jgi:hypothetical protein
VNVTFLPGFEPPSDKLKIWRYFTHEKFESLLKQSALYFASARQFSDKFEGSISIPDFARRRKSLERFSPDIEFVSKSLSSAFEQLRRLHKISCWHMNEHESAAMWSLYLNQGRGIAVQTTIARLIAALKPYRIEPHYADEDIELGVVRYVDYRTTKIEGPGFLGPFFHKRASYAHEAEFRAIVSLRVAEEFAVAVPEKGILVPVDLNELCQAVYIAPAWAAEYKLKVETLLKCAGVSCPVHHSELDDEALY